MRSSRSLFATLLVLFSLPVIAPGQQAQSESPQFTVTGTVRDSNSSAPMPGVTVSILEGPVRLQVSTDAEGRYSLEGLEPGSYRVNAYAPVTDGSRGWGPSANKWVSVGMPPQEIELDFLLRPNAVISGTVADEDRHPVPGLRVDLIGQRYFLGSLVQNYIDHTATDDRGRYAFQNVPPGVPYYIRVEELRRGALDTLSDTPKDPKLRRRIIVPIYFPASPIIEGAQAIVLRPGEHREVDVNVFRGPSYCLEGVVQSAGARDQHRFSVKPSELTIGGPSGIRFRPPTGTAGPDGSFRVCDLSPGSYDVTAFSDSMNSMGSNTVVISDRDIGNIVATPSPRLRIPGEVVWTSEETIVEGAGKIRISLMPIGRSRLSDEQTTVDVELPGSFEFEAALVGEYEVRVSRIPQDYYLRDITYGSQHVLGRRLRVGGEIGEAILRVILANDGGRVTVKAVDNEENPVPDANVCIIPSKYAPDAELAVAAVIGNADQNGVWTSEEMPPGEYNVLATEDSLTELFPELVASLRRALLDATEVELGSGESTVLSVPVKELQ